jgi:sec-independent protein translocase protein TatA
MFEGLFSPAHLILVLFIALIVFGPGRLPELGEALGQSIRAFRKGVRAIGEDALTATSAPTALPETAGNGCASRGMVNPAQNHFCGACGQALAAGAVSTPAS